MKACKLTDDEALRLIRKRGVLYCGFDLLTRHERRMLRHWINAGKSPGQRKAEARLSKLPQQFGRLAGELIDQEIRRCLTTPNSEHLKGQ